MCFIKSSPKTTAVQEEVAPVVERKEANAAITKNSANNQTQSTNQNIKTSPIGLTDEANVQKKTLLGE